MKIVVLLSGGLDSTALAALLRRRGHELVCIGIDYGQVHKRELACAAAVARAMDVSFTLVSLPALGLLLPSTLTRGGSSKVVPNRNAILASVAIGVAQGNGDAVALAMHADDAGDFFDCTPEWVYRMGLVAELAGVELLTPFLHLTKAEVVREGLAAGAPLELTRSCYLNDEQECGACDACHDKARALEAARVVLG